MNKKLLTLLIASAVIVAAVLQPFVRVDVDDFGVALRVRDSVHEKYTPIVLWEW
jgi:hypothetical protein